MNLGPDWRDALVELHILAEHGDPDAATRAARWLARDPAARHAWDAVQQTCDTVRGRTGHESATRRSRPAPHRSGPGQREQTQDVDRHREG
jgi:hypothetical protein